MKKTIQILCLLAISILLTGMAHAGSLNRKGLSLKRVRANLVNSVTKVAGLETFYGESFAISEIVGFGRGTSASRILKSEAIRLRNGQVYTPEESEYAYVPRSNRRSLNVTTVTANNDGKAPHERAPHEKAPHEKAPHEKAPHK